LTADTREAIDTALRQWEHCFNSGDTAGLAALYTEDATLMPSDAEAIRGRQGVQGFWQVARDGGVQQIMLHLGEVEVQGNLLIEISRATITVNAGGAATEVPVKYVVVWKRQGDGPWQVHVDMWSSTQGDARARRSAA
jgi:uncharacterized protein (TIGR02246 family)